MTWSSHRRREQVSQAILLLHVATLPFLPLAVTFALSDLIRENLTFTVIAIASGYAAFMASVFSLRFVMGYHDGKQYTWISGIGHMVLIVLLLLARPWPQWIHDVFPGPHLGWLIGPSLLALAIGLAIHPAPWWGPWMKERSRASPEAGQPEESSAEPRPTATRDERADENKASDWQEHAAIGLFLIHVLSLPLTFYRLGASLIQLSLDLHVAWWWAVTLLSALSVASIRFVMGYHDGKQIVWIPAVGYLLLLWIFPISYWSTIGFSLVFLLAGAVIHPAPWWGPLARRRSWPQVNPRLV